MRKRIGILRPVTFPQGREHALLLLELGGTSGGGALLLRLFLLLLFFFFLLQAFLALGFALVVDIGAVDVTIGIVIRHEGRILGIGEVFGRDSVIVHVVGRELPEHLGT